MKLQDSRPSGPEILQFKIGQSLENGLAFNWLAVVHGRLFRTCMRGTRLGTMSERL
jgi:hypothetical protein